MQLGQGDTASEQQFQKAKSGHAVIHYATQSDRDTVSSYSPSDFRVPCISSSITLTKSYTLVPVTQDSKWPEQLQPSWEAKKEQDVVPVIIRW